MPLLRFGWKRNLPFEAPRKELKALPRRKSRRARKVLALREGARRENPAHPREALGFPPPVAHRASQPHQPVVGSGRTTLRRPLSDPGQGPAPEPSRLESRPEPPLPGEREQLKAAHDVRHESRVKPRPALSRVERRRRLQLIAGANLVLPPSREDTIEASGTYLRARKSQWPRHSLGRCWPNTPTVGELAGWARAGGNTRAMPLKKKFFTQRRVLESPELLTSLVTKCILGVRVGVEIPEKFRGFFRYRWGMLLLIDTPYVPFGLVRFLTGLWLRRPKLIWSVWGGNFRSNLEFHSFEDVTFQVMFDWEAHFGVFSEVD
jgi:hypothetical protein